VVSDITNVIPDYMVMGERGMATWPRDGHATARQHRQDDDRYPFGSVLNGRMFSMA
jgi:hypothetical protein